MYKIKQIPEDFVVKEIIKPKLDKNGKYVYFWLRKMDWSTLSAVQAIANAVRKNVKDFGWAGNKDRHGITEQLISAENIDENKLKNIKIDGIEIKILGRSENPLTLGSNLANKFEIVIRNIDYFKKLNNISIPNYFDEQRFSSNNVEIGKSLVKRNFKEAIRLILSTNTQYNWKIEKRLKENSNDFVGALKVLPRKLLLIYLHAYQAKIFNQTVKNILKSVKKQKVVKTSFGELIFPLEEVENRKVRIVGFGMEPDAFLRPVMAAEGLSTRDFILKEFPELSSEGSKRNLLIKINKLKIGKLEKDELNQGKKKIKISFELPKGCYATIVIKALF